MSILKRLCAITLSSCLFLCGSGFSNRYKGVQRVNLESDPTTVWQWEAQVREYKESEKEEECSGCRSKRGAVEVAHTFKSDIGDDSICGTGGTDVFNITGKKEGGVVLEFLLVKNNNGVKHVDANKTVWATFCVNESKQVKIVSFNDSNWCCVNKK